MLVYQELCIDTCAFGVNGESALARKKKIRPQDLKDVRVLCGTYEYMEASFEEMLKDTGRKCRTYTQNIIWNPWSRRNFRSPCLYFTAIGKTVIPIF